jgi:hypothetical protein
MTDYFDEKLIDYELEKQYNEELLIDMENQEQQFEEFNGGIIRKLSIGLGFADKDMQMHFAVPTEKQIQQRSKEDRSPIITAILEDRLYNQRTGGTRFVVMVKDLKTEGRDRVWKKVENMPCVVEYDYTAE